MGGPGAGRGVAVRGMKGGVAGASVSASVEDAEADMFSGEEDMSCVSGWDSRCCWEGRFVKAGSSCCCCCWRDVVGCGDATAGGGVEATKESSARIFAELG